MKIKEVLAMIGDGPLIQALNERGYVVLGDDDDEDAIDYLEGRGHIVGDNHCNIEQGWILWRSRSPLFREWLRKFFWGSIGRGD